MKIRSLRVTSPIPASSSLAATRPPALAPLAVERAGYLEKLAAQATPHAKILIRAHDGLRSARGLGQWPQRHRFTQAEIDATAAQAMASGRASTPSTPEAKA